MAVRLRDLRNLREAGGLWQAHLLIAPRLIAPMWGFSDASHAATVDRLENRADVLEMAPQLALTELEHATCGLFYAARPRLSFTP